MLFRRRCRCRCRCQFLLHLTKNCNAKIVACIASIVQQLLQMPIVALIDIYFGVLRENTGIANNDYFVH